MIDMQELTKAEEQVMQVIWDLKEGFVKDIVAEFPDPKPAYNTVSTIIRILEKKKICTPMCGCLSLLFRELLFIHW